MAANKSQHGDWGILLLRAATGFMMLGFHGIGKLTGALNHLQGEKWGFVDVVGGIGFPLPGVFAFCSALAESVAALLLSAGLFTRWAAVALAANMVVAIYFHAAKGERSELAMFYLVAALVLALTGPGRWALDSRRK